MIARLHRALLRLAHRLARRLPRRRQAAAVALWHGGELLLVRHSYREGWSLPGGAARKGETLAQAAARELREEVGVAIVAADLAPAYTTLRVRVFEHEAAERPAVAVDGREVVEARFADPRRVDGLAEYVRGYLLTRAP